MKRWILLTALMSSGLFAQADNPQADRSDLPQFFFDALVFAGDDTSSSRLDVFVQVPYEALRFVQDNDKNYNTAYEQTISIYDSNKNLVAEKLSTEYVRRSIFAETIDPGRYNLTQRFFTLPPGRYTLDVQVRDEETKKSRRGAGTVNVRSMSDADLTISDLMLVNQLRVDGEKKAIVPNVSGNVADLPEGFYLFFEVYNRTDCDTLELTYQVKTSKNEERLRESFLHSAVRGRNPLFVKINSNSLPMGRYSVGMQATGHGVARGAAKATPVVTHPFIIQWKGIPATIEDLDAAINQLIYIAETKELDSIKSAPNADEKKKRFREFWKKRDPTPNTERNEEMEQYYSRVAIANKNYSHYTDGWKTDRGMVFIMFGPPSNIDRHPFDSDAKPYEIWYYNDLNYQFLFVDQTGFGDYRLDPSTPLWNIKNRRR